MKHYKEYLEAAGNLLEYPKPDYYWVAYKNGVVSKHSSKEAAFSVSSNCEKIESEESIIQRKFVCDNNIKVERFASDAWFQDLKCDWCLLPVKLFDLIYSEAWDQSHAYGYDAVAEKFESLADYANRIIDATK